MLQLLIGCVLSMAIFSTVQAVQPAELQKQADILREENQSLKAIDLYNQAIVQYQGIQDYNSILAALTGRLLSWKHLFYKTQDPVYAIFVKKDAEAMLEIAKTQSLLDRLYLIHFLNATSAMLFHDYALAEKEYNQALELYPDDNAEKGDWTAHLGEAIYRNGKKDAGHRMILQGIERIQRHASEIDSFLYNVWVSGAYLRLAKLLKNDNPQESQVYLEKAKKIIEPDPRLVIRKQQLEEFLKESYSKKPE